MALRRSSTTQHMARPGRSTRRVEGRGSVTPEGGAAAGQLPFALAWALRQVASPAKGPCSGLGALRFHGYSRPPPTISRREPQRHEQQQLVAPLRSGQGPPCIHGRASDRQGRPLAGGGQETVEARSTTVQKGRNTCIIRLYTTLVATCLHQVAIHEQMTTTHTEWPEQSQCLNFVTAVAACGHTTS